MRLSRRKFLAQQVGMLGAISLLSESAMALPVCAVVPAESASELRLGMAGYTFVKLNLAQSLSIMEKLAIPYLCIKDFQLPMQSSAEEISAFHARLAQHHIVGYAVGPIYMRTRSAIDEAFVYAQRVGVSLIVGIPDPADLTYISELCLRYSIRYAIHNHGPEDKVYPNAEVIYRYVEHLSPWVGICFDMGHELRDGRDPLLSVARYHDRIFDIHLKDVTAATAAGTTCELGRGLIAVPKFLALLKTLHYKGVCSLEFEKDMDDPMAGLAESIGYARGILAAQAIM